MPTAQILFSESDAGTETTTSYFVEKNWNNLEEANVEIVLVGSSRGNVASNTSKEEPYNEEGTLSTDNLDNSDDDESIMSFSSDSTAWHISVSQMWRKTILKIQKHILKILHIVSHSAATNPITYVVSIILISIAMVVLGLHTNFYFEVERDVVWTPRNSLPDLHGRWIKQESGFPEESRYFTLVVHSNGDNVLGNDGFQLAKEGIHHVFQALDVVRNTPGYDDLCEKPESGPSCIITSITGYWHDNSTFFEEEVLSNEDVIRTMSKKFLPNGKPVNHKQIIGYADFKRILGYDILTYGQSYVTVIALPPVSFYGSWAHFDPERFEKDALENVLNLRSGWKDQSNNSFHLEVLAHSSADFEMQRAAASDTPLLAAVFIVMSIMCVITFSKCDRVLSRGMLGFGVVVNVLLALLTGYGLMFTMGVPVTNLTMVLPFIIFGIGVDDGYIIAGSYERTDHSKDPVDRIWDTIDDVGGSILVTTLTSICAFALGSLSSLPAIEWLVAYACLTIFIDFLYQITFFPALIVIDQRRIEANRLDCIICCKSRNVSDKPQQTVRNFGQQVMDRYSNILLQPVAKLFVVVFFTALVGVCSYSASQLEQHFDVLEFVPSDSYTISWANAFDKLYEYTVTAPGVYFRDVDFSDEGVQLQMLNFVEDLSTLTQIAGQPFNFWLRDFQSFVASSNRTIDELRFTEKLALFLDDPLYFSLYKEDIVRNATGDMTTSRCTIYMDNVDYLDIDNQVQALEDQRRVSASQTINQGRQRFAFFTFEREYYLWEFYRVCVHELILSTVIGVVAVSLLSLIFIPHWSAVFFVGPLISLCYVDLIGVVQIAGLSIDPIVFITVVMSIGLMVDYIVHILIHFVKLKGLDRESKVKETLRSVGISVVMGGVTTLLGVSMLAFSNSSAYKRVFIIVFGLVTLSIGHGLVLLPVLLSWFGPIDEV